MGYGISEYFRTGWLDRVDSCDMIEGSSDIDLFSPNKADCSLEYELLLLLLLLLIITSVE